MKYKLALVSLLFCSSCLSDEFRLGFGVGRGNVDLSSGAVFNGYDATGDAVSGVLYGGYLFDNGILIDLQYGSMTDDVLFGSFDSVHLDTYEVLVGYRFEYNSFYFEPKVGYAKWDLDLQEGAFLHPGPEGKTNIDGSDPLATLAVGYSFSSVFGMSLSYKYQDLEHASADSYYLNFDFKF